MRVYGYTNEQIEKLADEENARFDAERLDKLKPIDVYDYGERILGLDFDWKYITPNCTCDGVTFFTRGNLWAFPCFFDPRYEMLPSKEEILAKYKPVEIEIAVNTVVICQSLIDRGLIAKEKFAVMHECGHYKLHPKGFPKGRSWQSNGKHSPYVYGSMQPMTAEQKAEAQANLFAAAMLMPRTPVIATFKSIMEIGRGDVLPLPYSFKAQQVLEAMAEICGASPEAMANRLNSLGLLQKKFD